MPNLLVNNQLPFDPVTEIPIFGENLPPLTTPNGAPINFYVPSPPPSQQASQPSMLAHYLPYIIGAGTMLALVSIYLIIRDKP